MALIIIGPMFACTYQEKFAHNVNLEFNADYIYAMKLRGISTDKIQNLSGGAEEKLHIAALIKSAALMKSKSL